jgi:hypothetical protein
MLLLAEQRGEAVEVSSPGTDCIRSALPMLSTAHWLTDAYGKSPYSALPGGVFESIVRETCMEFIEMHKSSDRTRLPTADIGPMLRLEEFLDYWRELLLGTAFKGEGSALYRSLTPWSTAATHNLITLLCDPQSTPKCNIVEPPEVLSLRMAYSELT